MVAVAAATEVVVAGMVDVHTAVVAVVVAASFASRLCDGSDFWGGDWRGPQELLSLQIRLDAVVERAVARRRQYLTLHLRHAPTASSC